MRVKVHYITDIEGPKREEWKTYEYPACKHLESILRSHPDIYIDVMQSVADSSTSMWLVYRKPELAGAGVVLWMTVSKPTIQASFRELLTIIQATPKILQLN